MRHRDGGFEVLDHGKTPAAAAAVAKALDAGGVSGIARDALARARSQLPGPPIVMCLYPGELSGGLPYLHGVGGASLGGGRVKLFLHPQPQGLDRVSDVTAHEYFHAVNRARGPWGSRPIDIVIREGKADFFAVTLYSNLWPGTTSRLSNGELDLVWDELLEYQRAPTAGFQRDFMMGRNPAVMAWPGYRLGFEMVESLVSDRRLALEEWFALPADAFLSHFVRHRKRRW